jgi:hypothetical protein
MLRSCTVFFDASSSPKKIVPPVGLSSPATSLSSVVLPEPEGPRSAISSPDRMSRETSSSAGKRPNSLRMFWTRTSMEVWTFQCLRLAAISSL